MKMAPCPLIAWVNRVPLPASGTLGTLVAREPPAWLVSPGHRPPSVMCTRLEDYECGDCPLFMLLAEYVVGAGSSVVWLCPWCAEEAEEVLGFYASGFCDGCDRDTAVLSACRIS